MSKPDVREKAGFKKDRKSGQLTKVPSSRLPADGNGAASAAQERVEVPIEDYFAAQLHEARASAMELRQNLLKQSAVILQRDQAILQRDQVILNLESKLMEDANKKLREDHGLELGKSMEKDPETGKVYWKTAVE